MDLSKIPTEDLIALQSGDLSRVSTATLQAMSPAKKQAKPNYSPTSGMSTTDLALSGVGKGMVDMYRGGKQMLKEHLQSRPTAAWDGSQFFADMIDTSDIAESRKLDAPLMKTTAGKVGNVGGQVAMSVPAMFVPGANTVAGAGLIGAAMGGLEPTVGDESRLKNMAISGAVGAGAQKAVGVAGQYVADRFGRKVIQGAQQQPANALKDATLQNSQASGYVVPPSMADGPTSLKLLEGLSGKYKTNQLASIRNQEVTNKLAKRAVGIPDDVPLTPDVLQQVRDGAGQAYAAIEALPAVNWDKTFLANVKNMQRLGGATTNPADEEIRGLIQQLSNKNQWTGSEVVADIKNLREIAKSYHGQVQSKQGSVGAQNLAKAYQRGADALEDLVERNLKAQGGNQAAVQELKDARQLIAKTYNIERALIGENVNAKEFAKALGKGKPLTGDLEKIARFATNFKDVARVPESGWANPLTAVDFGVGALGAGVSPMAMALPAARVGARYGILSGPAQQMLGSRYGPGLLDFAALKALNNPISERAGLLGALGYAGQE
jgi:hypothetical protein